jgi:hypothetical protein
VRAGVPRPYDIYDLLTDSAGHVHVAMVGYLEGSSTMALLHSVWDGQSWSRPDVITGSPLYPEYPKLALSGGNRLHVSWFVGDKPGVERGPVSAWYSSRMVDAPSTTRAGWAPVPTPTAPLGAAARAPAPEQYFPPSQLSDAHRADAVFGGPAWLDGARQNPAFPLIVALIPILLVLGLTIALKLDLFKRYR